MAENKKSFLLYCDLISMVNKLPNDKAGELFKLILSYVNDENPDLDNIDFVLQIAFEPIKQSLKRDLEKYHNIVERNRLNGTKGGRPKKAKKPSGLIGNPNKPKKADSVNDSDSVNDNVIKKNIPALEDFISYALEKKPDVNSEAVSLKYESWTENGWKDGNNKPIKNWKSKILNTLPYLKDEKTGTNNKRGFKSNSSQQAANAIMQRIQSKAGNGIG